MQSSYIWPFLCNLVVKLLEKHRSGTSTMATTVVFHNLADRLLRVRMQSAQSNTQQPQELHSYFIHHFMDRTPLARSKSVEAQATPLPNQRSSFRLFCISCSEVRSSFLSSCLCKPPQLLSSSLSLLKYFLLSLFLSLSGVRFPSSTTRGSVVSLPSF